MTCIAAAHPDGLGVPCDPIADEFVAPPLPDLTEETP